MTPIQTNKPLFFADDGEALEGGQIYVGQPSTDPRTNPKTVTFRDSGGAEFTAKQPMETLAGRIVYNGKPIVALVDGEYSLLILDSAGKQLDYSRSVTPSGSAGDAIADFSEVIRVGLTLSEIQSFDVSVGESVRNVGKITATDDLGADWLVVSATGSPADDVDLIDFENGLQGERINNVAYRSVISDDIGSGRFKPESPTLVWSGSASSVDMTDLSEQGPGFYTLVTANGTYGIQVLSETLDAFGGAKAGSISTTDLVVTVSSYQGGTFFVRSFSVSSNTGTSSTLSEIYKV